MYNKVLYVTNSKIFGDYIEHLIQQGITPQRILIDHVALTEENKLDMTSFVFGLWYNHLYTTGKITRKQYKNLCKDLVWSC